jgi:hypothetical protein
MSLLISGDLRLAKGYSLPDDADAVAYIAAVEAADGQALETATRMAINSFVKGCKNDGIWPAIKASCILAGARTLAGALVPLVGAAPTNNGFIGIGTDYVRKTGLVGDGSTKYLDSNRNNNTDPQDSKHLALFVHTAGTPSNATQVYATNLFVSLQGMTSLGIAGSAQFTRNNCNAATTIGSSTATGFYGTSRNQSAFYLSRSTGANNTINTVSDARADGNIFIYRDPNPSFPFYTNARLAFYSIGESLDLALLDARVTDLINAFAVAIP